MGIKLGNRGKFKAHLVLLVVGITSFAALVPDLVDKPLWLLGLGDGRTHHEALGYLGIINVIVGIGIIFSLVCGFLGSRFLRRKNG